MNDTIQKIADELYAVAQGSAPSIKHQRDLNRVYLIAERLTALSARASAGEGGASGGVWAPTCQKCRMTITRPGECAIGGQHCQCSATPASPATGEEWRCFHCDEAFTDRDAAALHFGAHECQRPACLIDAAEYRRMEAKEARYAEEDADCHRAMHRQASEHQVALRRAEEAGYAKGLRDSGKCPCATPPAHGDGEDLHHAVWSIVRPYIQPAAREKVNAALKEALTTRPTPEAQEARDADMFWDYDDNERCYDSIIELVSSRYDDSDASDGDVIRIQRAAKLPDMWVRLKLTAETVNHDSELDYEVIDAALALPAQGEG